MEENNNSIKELIKIIEIARMNTLRQVNVELIRLYWNVGEFLSVNSELSKYGDAFMDMLAKEIQNTFPGIKGFTRRNLYRMKQFYEAYAHDEFVTPLVTQISWTNHLLILSGSESVQERRFYVALAAEEQYSKRELERQINSGYYERYALSQRSLNAPVPYGFVRNPFLDSYVFEFANLPEAYKEADFRKELIKNMKMFILELGKDFIFVDEEYKIQVGGEDYFVDLLFFHRGLQCLVALELKIGKFKPEFVSKMNFYLEALDRKKKKECENPSVGLILCASINDEVVEYALNRNMSPMLVSEYRLQLPDKKVLRNRLRELVLIPDIDSL